MKQLACRFSDGSDCTCLKVWEGLTLRTICLRTSMGKCLRPTGCMLSSSSCIYKLPSASAMRQPCVQCADASCITNYQLIVRLYYHSFWCNILAICWSHEDKMCLTTNSMSVSFATAACVCVCICAEWHLHMMQHVYVYVYVQSGICIWCSTGMCMYICSHTCIWCSMSAQKACSCFCNPLMRCCDWPSSVSFEFISSVSVLAMDRSTCSICYMFIYLFVYSN